MVRRDQYYAQLSRRAPSILKPREPRVTKATRTRHRHVKITGSPLRPPPKIPAPGRYEITKVAIPSISYRTSEPANPIPQVSVPAGGHVGWRLATMPGMAEFAREMKRRAQSEKAARAPLTFPNAPRKAEIGKWRVELFKKFKEGPDNEYKYVKRSLGSRDVPVGSLKGGKLSALEKGTNRYSRRDDYTIGVLE